MIGSLFALLSAVSFALDAIFIRRAVLKVPDSRIGMLISVPMALPFFIFILALSGQMQSILNFSWQSYVWLSLAGVLFFVVGRFLYYKCIQIIGANITFIFARVNIIVAVVIGISALNEPLSWQLVIGVVLIITGVTLVGLHPQLIQNPYSQLAKIPAKALVLGTGCGVAWGLAPIFVKLGLKGLGSPIAGAFISFLAATTVLSISLMNQKQRTLFAHLTGKAAMFFFIAGFFNCTANLTRYTALSLAPASVVTTLIAIAPIFLLVFSFLFNRNLEIFSKRVIIGSVTVVTGSVLLI